MVSPDVEITMPPTPMVSMTPTVTTFPDTPTVSRFADTTMTATLTASITPTVSASGAVSGAGTGFISSVGDGSVVIGGIAPGSGAVFGGDGTTASFIGTAEGTGIGGGR
ncbi:hypothetical protein FGB62_84g04 [Gracilaria domingensis]|nr:hypothetical protein FGB62_84g04 [Gracilaria domingensis]